MKSCISKKIIKKLLGGKETPVILEIGSHYGEDTKEFLNTFSKIKLYCFEPDPRNLQIIKKYLDTTKFVLYEKAISDKNETEVDFYMSYKELDDYTKPLKKYNWISEKDFLGLKLNRSGASSLKKGHEAVENAKRVKIETMKLDTWFENEKVSHVDFIWMDVQGSEKNVITGGKKTFKSTKFVFIEYGEIAYEGGLGRNETISLMNELGFEVIKKYSDTTSKGNLLFEREL